ncbi:malto-oligosyltrehalose synthase [Kozakia baliensis]|uniref:Uncharacterized protein n=1 Tax=Kozakia baliensis TaxID=153496 RepID=A0A1D8UQQ0_9PROT|nr:malto-oligosyltrehalose synthase [Kozakia baliensis]AOX15975.1 hypothetical protein A0U89_01200 [Kozakia baliensis]GBR27309.1 1,4-alpha-D-glucan 1-alpha-D-glucosylmutase [Kozakia baliensis NRIC 0488]GEL64127.1 malto-oligosyltrehalose synthase [Kozakia baliensis]
MTTLRSTVRLQFHRNFTLDDAIPLVPYFAQMGLSHIYASPLLTANPGSLHGYDTVDCQEIDPERGGIAGLRRLVAELRAHDMGLILDIVPNHMGVSPHNHWWQNVLALGPASPYAQYFDIDWQSSDPSLQGKVLLPFLGSPLNQLLDQGDISLHFARNPAGFLLHYGEHRFPISPSDTPQILNTADIPLPDGPILEWLAHTENSEALAQIGKTYASKTEEGCMRLEALLDRQHYRLAWWRTAGDLINWRRFFDVTSLVALKTEREETFEAIHRLVFELYREGLIDGLRIDHIDGLSRPDEYCRRLRSRLEELRPLRPEGLRMPPTLHVEKILEDKEKLPAEWRTSGTTGYDFLEQAALLLHDPEGETPLTAFWEQFGPADYHTTQRQARSEKLENSFPGELKALVRCLTNIPPISHDVTEHAAQTAIHAILLAFPVYRSYFSDGKASTADRQALAHACDEARRHVRPYLRELVTWIEAIMSDRNNHSDARREVVERFEHLTAPLTAKAGEDTAFYRYRRLLSRNDVGTDPARFAAPITEFHTRNTRRLHEFPQALVGTATHDHKRGEDGRARLMVLSETGAEWPKTAESWFRTNNLRHRFTPHGTSPTRSDELLIYQTLISAWPNREEEFVDFSKRLNDYLVKALREAGENTSWSTPDENYEAACHEFLAGLLTSEFRAVLEEYIRRIAPAGILNSLSQTLLRLTSPGVPDLYQGREGWDYSLVDPDNRRPVDYPRYQALLSQNADFNILAAQWRDGRIKQFIIQRVLNFRKQHAALFAEGEYVPVAVTGRLAKHLVAFIRRNGSEEILVLAPRLTFALSPDEELRVFHEGWEHTHLSVGGKWTSLLRERDIDLKDDAALSYFHGDTPLDILKRA